MLQGSQGGQLALAAFQELLFLRLELGQAPLLCSQQSFEHSAGQAKLIKNKEEWGEEKGMARGQVRRT